MLSRRELRRILRKHQHEFQKYKLNISVISSDHNNINDNNNDNNSKKLNSDRAEATLTHRFTKVEKDESSVKADTHPNNGEMQADTFHRAVCPILILAQCFAVMPVVGVRHRNPRHMRFSSKSVQMIVTLLFLICSLVLLVTMVYHLSIIGVNAKNTVGAVFFANVQIACILFLLLAPRWPRLMRYWARTEKIFNRPPYKKPKRKLDARVRHAAVAILLLSLLEHGLYMTSAIFTYRRRAQTCPTAYNTTRPMSYRDFVMQNYDYVFELLPYTTFIGAFILMTNGACTFIWNYMDLFIMMISTGIAYRFEQVTERINSLADKEVSESIFIEIREHYVKLCELLESVDENLSGIILLSCINNLYFVCYQLLNIFNKLRWPINYIYFWYSLLYLMGRTTFVFLTAASINDESKRGLSVLRRLSKDIWYVEVERLIFQMTTQTVALSGKKFYFLTRSLLFGMAGTIVTYELVLLQFDEPNRAKGLPELCA